jgi:hypothetical protein
MGSPEIDEMSKLATEMLKDTEKLVKITDKDLIKQDRYSKTSGRLIDLKLDLMTDEIDILEEQNKMLSDMEETLNKTMSAEKVKETMRAFKLTKMSGLGFGGSAGPAAGAGSVSAPVASPGGGSNVVSGSGQPIMTGAGVPLTTQSGPEPHGPVPGASGSDKPELSRISSKSGKSTMVNAKVAGKFQSLIDYMDSVGYEINSLGGYNDRNIAGTGQKSVHARGGAIDINPGANPMGSQLITDMPANIASIAANLGLGWGGNWKSKKDAMHFSAATNEGGAGFSDGGVAVGPRSGYLAKLHGPEAVVPLPDGKTIPVNIQGSFENSKMFDTLKSDMGNMMSQVRDVLNIVSQKMDNAHIASLMDEMVRAQKSSVDIQEKMLRAQL